jgi:hypothetical protein
VSYYILCYCCVCVVRLRDKSRKPIVAHGAKVGSVVAALLGDLLQLTDFQTYLGIDCLNVYYYRVTSITGFAFAGYNDIMQWYRDHILAQVKNQQVSGVSHNMLEIRNLSNAVDFDSLTFAPGTQVGAQPGEGLPSYVTYTFRLLRENLNTRNGYKRFVGVPESQGSGNAYSPSGAAITNICGELSSDIVAGIVLLAEPVIVKRPILTPAGAYVYSSIGNADFRGVGSQNTRKR